MEGSMSDSNPFPPKDKLPLQKTTLLLVDDQRSNLIALEAVLSGPEYNLILAQSGMEAIELVKRHDIALILLDIQMPGLDGFETARRIKAMESGRDIPIIFITGHPDDNVRARAMKAGAVAFLGKPIDAGHFSGCVAKALKAA